MSERITLRFDGPVATLKLNHPEVLNAISGQMLNEFFDAVAEVKDPENRARGLLITGEGRGFCAGANLQSNDRPKNGPGSGLRGGWHPLLAELRDLPMPIVTAVNGVAAGAGMSFALMGDIVCASRSAYFLQAFTRVGLVPDCGSTFMLPRLIGWGRAMELSLLAERLPAERALEWGLISRLYEDNDELIEGASDIITKLANGPRSIALTREAYWASWNNSFEQQLDVEARLQAAATASSDSKEGKAAFVEKRSPKFTGS